jgi:serine/threonine-protein phosphatase PP1-1
MPDTRPPVEIHSKPANVINPADIEPPTTITDPRAKRKMKRRYQRDSNYTGPASPPADSEQADEDAVAGDDAEDDEDVQASNRDAGNAVGQPAGDEENEVAGRGVNSSNGSIGRQNYIFLGDFVDRGYFSL